MNQSYIEHIATVPYNTPYTQCFSVKDSTLRLKRETEDLLSLCFVDDQHQPIPAPNGFTLTVDHDTNQKAMCLDNVYVMYWLNSYVAKIDGSFLLEVRPRRASSIWGLRKIDDLYNPTQ